MGKAKRKVKTKEKKPKKPRNKNKGPLWALEGDRVMRKRRPCPKCGNGVYMAEHYDRMHCGSCGYTMFKRANAPEAAAPAVQSRRRSDS